MALGTDKVLGPQGAGILDANDVITQAHRDKFVADVVGIMVGGNEDGMGLTHTFPPVPLPIYPVPGPHVVVSLFHPEGENLLWFKPAPESLALIPILMDKEKPYQKLIIDGLYAPLCKMLNIAGGTNLGPIFDPTIAIDLSLFPDITLPDIPDILAQIVALLPSAPTVPAIKLKLDTDFGIGDVQLPDLLQLVVPPALPDLSPPTFSIPILPIPNFSAGIPSFNFPDIALGILKIPALLIPQLMTLITDISFDPLALILKIIKLIIDIILKILALAGLPKLLLATIMVIVKNMAVMLLCDVIGKLLGTGALVKITATLGGLV